MNELAHERRIAAAERKVETARRRFAAAVVRLYEAIAGVSLARHDATPRRHGPADHIGDMKRRRVRDFSHYRR